MKVCVTGGAGYVGSVIALQLKEQGYQVLVLDNLSTGHLQAIGDHDFTQLDLCTDNLQCAIEGCQAVIHCAALSLVGQSVEQPDRYWYNNTYGTFRLLEAMREVDCKQIVFSSTAATYGQTSQEVIQENHTTQPTNPYGASKLAVDYMLSSYCQAYDFSATSLRYFNVAGSYKHLGEDHQPETHLIPCILKALANDQPLNIFGTDYPTHDGTAVRDYIHIDDLAQAHLLALQKTTPSRHNIYNLGTSQGYSVSQVINQAQKVTGIKPIIKHQDRRPGDPACLIASNQLAKDKLGWNPKAGIEQMIEDAWRWYKQNPQGYQDN